MKTAKSLGVDCIEEEKLINEMKESAKLSGYLSKIEILRNEPTLKKQTKRAQALCDEIAKKPEELKLLSNASSRFEKIFNIYHHKQVVSERMEGLEDSQHAGVIHKTYDELDIIRK